MIIKLIAQGTINISEWTEVCEIKDEDKNHLWTKFYDGHTEFIDCREYEVRILPERGMYT